MVRRPALDSIATPALWLALILLSGLALWGTRPPPAVSASTDVNVFSAARAMSHLMQIARQPHPIGSDEADRVREYLMEQLRALGGEVHVEQAIGTAHQGRNFHSGLVNNIVARFPGQATTRAILLVAHYDSVPEGPGAADDGAGLVVILEAIRAFRAGSPSRNDLVILFSDGEEARGLLGAQAFAAGHPDLADRIGIMVNLEARGSSGPALMFETSDHNGALIRGFARSAPYPMATSLMAAIYKLLPNDTDFTPLKAAGVSGLNFAFLETYRSYHTRLDTIEHLDPRSVQHLGANVLGIIRHFGNLALPQKKEADLIYCNWFGSGLLVYPAWLAWVVGLLAPILFVVGCVFSATRGELTLLRIVAGFGSFFLQLATILGGSFGAFAVARLIAGEFLEGDTFSNQLLFVGVMATGFGLALTVHRFLGNRIGLENLAIGQLFAVALLTLILCRLLAGGSYVLQWPLVFAMAGLLVGACLVEPTRSICQFVFLIPAILILVPLAYMFFVALNFTYPALTAAAFLLAILLAMSPPLFDRLAGRLNVSLAAVFLLSASLIAVGIRLSKWSANHPRRDTLIYSVNADENKAKWVSYDAQPDAWTSSILGSSPGKRSHRAYTGLERPVLSSDATLVPLSAPFVAITQNSVLDGEQTVRLQITSTRGARSLLVRLPRDLKLSSAGWNGNVQAIHDKSQTNLPWTFRFYNAPAEGASLELRFPAQSSTPIRIWVADTTPALPPIAPLSARPNDTTPGYGSDITLVAKTLEL